MKTDQPKKAKIVVTGILFWYPLAGVTYQFLHYLIGLRKLGYDVYYLEDPSQWVYNPKDNDLTPDADYNVNFVAPILEKYGFKGKWGFAGNYHGGKNYGLTRDQMKQLYRDADALLNVTGQEIRDEHRECNRLIYVESDPFSFQVKAAQGDEGVIKHLKAHDVFFSFGENLGAPDCTVPLGGVKWLPTRQPVQMDLWSNSLHCESKKYTTITTWKNKGKDINYDGDTYFWTKDREFEKFIDLPLKTENKFELATNVDQQVHDYLTEYRWDISSAHAVSRNLYKYQNYIKNSWAEFTVARDQYVRPNTGWFSDRSVCYLAANRPVITQETGFSKFLPTGKGLFSFSTMDHIIEAVEAIESDYEGNCKVAKEIATEYFSTEKVLSSLMERAGL
ncbi:MAG: hypothetical protein KAT71_07830 [Gammaproteobacteria bacterium]|nr:hypothetical protein [Gammaproteobacteria bacterium]